MSELNHRAARAMLAGLLSSHLTDSELDQLVKSIDYEVLEEVRRLLSAIQRSRLSTSTVRVRNELSMDALDAADLKSLIDTIYSNVRSRKIGIDRLLKYIKEIDPLFERNHPTYPPSTNDLIRLVADTEGRSLLHALLSRITGTAGEDPYLKEIARRP